MSLFAGQPQHLKRRFFLENRLIHFHINRIIVIRQVSWSCLITTCLKQKFLVLRQLKLIDIFYF